MATAWRFCLVCIVAVCWGRSPLRADENVKITVLAILANANDDKVCPKCGPIAKEIQKRDPTLTSFHIERTTVKTIPVGSTVKFPLVEKTEVAVTVESPVNQDGKVSITIEPPTLGAVTYTCKGGKSFPILTRYRTATGDRLILAVMADACEAKKD